MFKPYVILALITMANFAPHLDAKVVRRAVFDFGSGSIRVHVADVDTETQQVARSLYAEHIEVDLSEDLAKQSDRKFSEEIQKAALHAAEKLKQKAIELKVKEFYGIATEAYRSALNGEELVERYFSELSIPVEIVSKETEGKYSFLTLAKERKADPRRMICCDIGGGSFQITYMDQMGEIKVYHGPYGRITTKNAIITHVKQKSFQEMSSPNPMTLKEWEEGLHFMRSALPPVPQDLLDKIDEPDVQIIGVAGHPPELVALGIYRTEDLMELRDQYLNKRDQELSSDQPFFLASYAVSDLILVGALMEKLGVNEFFYYETHGSSNSTALLITEELWNNL